MGSFLKILKRIRAFFPTALPRGAQEFDHFCDNFFSLYDLPDNNSFRHTIATMILHLNPTQSNASLHYFAQSIRKAMSNQVAFDKLQDFKAQLKAEETASTSEATTTPIGESPDVPTPLPHG